MQNKRPKHNFDSGKITNEYKGYSVRTGTVLEVKNIEDLTDESFFNDYVGARKPVKLIGSIESIDINKFKFKNLVEYLKWDSKLKVERKFKEGFGSNLERVEMTLEELVKHIEKGDNSYYLTTQYGGELKEEKGAISDQELEVESDVTDNKEPEEEEDETIKETIKKHPFNKILDGLTVPEEANDSDDSIDFDNVHDDYDYSDDEAESDEDEMQQDEVQYRVKELFQPPLTNLCKEIPLPPKLFLPLIPQQINLWLGYVGNENADTHHSADQDFPSPESRYIPDNGTSSGLHHDHADNLYVLVSGRKRFTLFSPDYADRLYTVGSIYKIFESGIIDYEIDENAPEWRHLRSDGALVREVARWRLEQENVNPEVRTELLEIMESCEKEEHAKHDSLKPTSPPSFSRIPPLLLHIESFPDSDRSTLTRFAHDHFPGFLELPRLTVWLQPGEMLYLPTGWFHEVSSFGCDTSSDVAENVHIALNYWFIPPNSSSYSAPYADTYWRDDFERTKRALTMFP